MKKILLVLFTMFLFISCSENSKNEILCDSSNDLCKFFEIKLPEIAEITEDNAALSAEDLNTYLEISKSHFDNSDSDSIFHMYSNGIFIPRFSFSVKDENYLEKLWLGLALYPLDKKNELIDTTEEFYNHEDFVYQTQSIYGNCSIDKNSYLSKDNAIIYNCQKENLYSYDYWIEDEDFMWRLKCVWDSHEFLGVNQGLLLTKNVSSSETCRNSFQSFKSKIN